MALINLRNALMSGKKDVISFLRFNSNGQETSKSINLGIAPSLTDVYEIVCRKIPNISGDTQFFGVYAGNDSRDVRLFYTSGTILYWDFGNRRVSGEYADFANGSDFVHITADSSSLASPKKTLTFSKYTGSLSTSSMFLFGIRLKTYNTISSRVQSDISSFRITRNGNIIMDLVARNDAIRGGYMFDLISENSFYPMNNGRYEYMEESI